MPKWLQRLLTILLTWWLLALFVQPFSVINPIAHPRELAGYVVIISLISYLAALWPRAWPIWLTTAFLSMIVGLWAILPLKQHFGLTWFNTYVQTFNTATRRFLQVGGVDVPATLSMTLIVALVAFLLLITVVLQLYPGAVAIVLSYLLAVHVFNGSDLTTQFFQLAVVTGLLAVLHLYHTRWRAFLIGSLSIVGLTLGLMWLSTSTPLNDWLANISVPARERLNQRGFYASLEAYANGSGRTGFTENSRVLGGPVYDDPTPVFTATSREAHYYRVEVDSFYTGTGWRPSTFQTQAAPLDGAIMRDPSARVDYGQATSVKLVFNGGKTFLPLPYGQLTFTGGKPDPTTDFLLNSATQRITASDDQRFERLDIQVQQKQFTDTQLETATSSTQLISSSYLRLPSSLPQRVRTLAKRITADAKTPYEKVIAIQTYLRSDPRFTYSKTDAQQTPANRDYVDYFLFDSPIGYCDNFSSAMVVLCRSINLPARWAKGFNTGTFEGGSGANKQYIIRNSNAHSWPEIYFNNLGWVPFEPTPGFSNPATPDDPAMPSAASNTASQSASSSAVSSAVSSSESRSIVSTSSTQPKPSSRSSLGSFHWTAIIVLTVVLTLCIVLIWQLPALVAFTISFNLTQRNFPRRYRLLLWSLRRVTRRQSSQPLTVYAHRIDTRLGDQRHFTTLTHAYEAWTFGHVAIHPDPLTTSLKSLSTQLAQYARRKFHVKQN